MFHKGLQFNEGLYEFSRFYTIRSINNTLQIVKFAILKIR
jgi:hypothetical protein